MNDALWWISFYSILSYYYLGEKKDLDLQNWLHNPPIGQDPKFEDSGWVLMKVRSWYSVLVSSLGFASVSQVRIPPATASFSYHSCKHYPSLPGFSEINGTFHNARRLLPVLKVLKILPNVSSVIFWEKPGAILAKTCWQPVLRTFFVFC